MRVRVIIGGMRYGVYGPGLYGVFIVRGVSWRGGRFVINLKKQSKHWPKGSKKIETIPSFSLDLNEGNHLFNFDVKFGYHHLFLHPAIRDYFLFRYAGKYYRCIALPFGWRRSGWWFTKLLRPLVQYLRTKMGFQTLPYIDDLRVSLSRHGRVARSPDAAIARQLLTRLFNPLRGGQERGEGGQDRCPTHQPLGYVSRHCLHEGVCVREQG